ncbi:Imm9 family immunity protein [Hymenobacter gelipurpurascens]
MQFSIKGHTSLVLGLFDLIETEGIDASLASLLQRATHATLHSKLDEWEVVFKLIFNGGISDIRVYHRYSSDPRRREKWVMVHVPIPTTVQVKWGAPPQAVITLQAEVGDEKWFRTVPGDLSIASTLQEHCCIAARVGILLALTTGLTVGGQRVQVEPGLLQ